MRLHPHERCTCPAVPVRLPPSTRRRFDQRDSGRSYYGWKACTRCSLLRPKSAVEEASLRAEAQALDLETREREVLTDAQVMKILSREIGADPSLSNTDLRFRVSIAGTYRCGDPKFARLVNEAREELGLPRRRPVAQARRVG